MNNVEERVSNYTPTILSSIFLLFLTLCIMLFFIFPEVKKTVDFKDNTEKSVGYSNTGCEAVDAGGNGMGEDGTGQTTGTYITKYNKWFWEYTNLPGCNFLGYASNPGIKKEAWCLIFIDWCAYKAGCVMMGSTSAKGYYNTAACASAKSYYQSVGRYQTISTQANLVSKSQPGDVIFYQNFSGSNHVGLVVSNNKTTVVTIDGNLSKKVKSRTFQSSSATSHWSMYFRGLGRPYYRSTATFYTNGASIKSVPSGWTYVGEGGSGSSKYYKYKYFEDMGSGSINLPQSGNLAGTGTFQGWFTNSSFSSAQVTYLQGAQRGNKTFYAKWSQGGQITTPPPTTPPTKAPDIPPVQTEVPDVWYNVTLLPNGGSIAAGHNVTSYKQGVGTSLPGSAYVTRHGYDFTGWFDYYSYSSFAIDRITATDSGDKTFYAKWKPKVYSVTLDPTGGTITPGHNVTSYTFGVGATLPTEPYVSKVGHNFMGWFTSSGTKVTQIGPTETGNKTFYARWEPKVYKVTLHPNGGTLPSQYDVTEYTYGVGAILPNPTQITYPGKEFGGWFDNEGLNGTPVKAITTTDLEDKEYWAKWITFTIESEDDTVMVYGLHNDTSVHRSDKYTFKVTTESSSPMRAYFTEAKSPTSTAYPGAFDIVADKEYSVLPPLDATTKVAEKREKKQIYFHVRTTCTYNDSKQNYTYYVYNTFPVLLKYTAAFNER